MSETFPPMDDAFITPDKQVAQLRVPPHSIESESSVLGGLLLDNSAWDRAGDLLTDSDFYRFEHRLIYAAIDYPGDAVDAGLLHDHLESFFNISVLKGRAEPPGGAAARVSRGIPDSARTFRRLEM